MFKNYLKIAFRHLKQNKIYSLISISGLAIGIASCILIAVYVQDELSYDKFNEKAEQIYRVNFYGDIGANAFKLANSPSPLAKELRGNFPEVVNSGRFFSDGDVFIKHGDGFIKEENFLYADQNILDIFTINFISGSPADALIEPNIVIINETAANKYFGGENPLGREIILDNKTKFKITGVTADLPSNSHYKFDFLASSASTERSKVEIWLSNNAYTYIVLQENYNPKLLSDKFPVLVKDKMSKIIQMSMGMTYDEFVSSGRSLSFALQPLLDIHLYSELDNGLQPSGDIRIVYIFSAVAFIILLLAVINFINLTTARASQRANEIGIRKASGSSRSQLIMQFLAESAIVTIIAVGAALLLIEICIPFFNRLAAKNLQFSIFSSWEFLLSIPVLIIFTSLISGAYPAFLLSSFKPVSVLKGNYQLMNQKGTLRKSLVVFQYVISTVLIIGTIVIYFQMQYVQNKNLGYEREHVVVIDNAAALGNQQTAFKNELLKNSLISKASYSHTLQTKQLSATIFQTEQAGTSENYVLLYLSSDQDFLETFKLELAEGRFFSDKFPTDTAAVLLNESAVKSLGISDALQKRLIMPGDDPEKKQYLNIIGVIKDFHTTSLHENIRPMALILESKLDGLDYLSIRIQPGNIEQALETIKSAWEKILPEQPLEYSFFDESFEEEYKTELRTSEVFTSFAVLAVVIASLGLFGLASFTTERRTKEIGVRKALGASIVNIIFLLTKDFSRWVIIANLIAWPLAWYAMNKWLENFAYKIDMELWIFILSGLITLSVAVLTVCFQAVKAAAANPIKALRYE